jgi:hypothetical protein
MSMVIGPVIYVKKQFPDDMLAEKVAQPDYDSKYKTPINFILSLAFVVGGFFCLFILPKWLS